jgi:hypothetical protein
MYESQSIFRADFGIMPLHSFRPVIVRLTNGRPVA